MSDELYDPVVLGGEVRMITSGRSRGRIIGGRKEWRDQARFADVLVWAPTVPAQRVDPLLGLRLVYSGYRRLYARGLSWGRSRLAELVRLELRKLGYFEPSWTSRGEAQAIARALVQALPGEVLRGSWLARLLPKGGDICFQ